MKFIWQQKIRVLMFSFYVVVFRDQDAGRNHSIKIDNSSFESVEGLKYLGTTWRNKFFFVGAILM